MNNQTQQYLNNRDVEQEVHERMVKALNPPKFDEDEKHLIDFTNYRLDGYRVSDSSEYQDENSGIRIAIAAFTILLLVAIAWYYSPAINYILQGGVK